MAVKIIDVKQVKGNFYGGLPYRVSWSFGGESEPSKLTVDVVNEKGQYQKANLSFLNTETVTIGKFKFEGFLVSYSLNTTPEQKTLTLEYVDKSVLLDKFWVGLHKQHGDKNSPWPNTIILGKQYHPCDVNMDSMVDYTEKNVKLIDPCDPCPYSPVDKYDEACDPRNELVENYETYYTFSELINRVKRVVPDLSIDFDASNLYMYKAQHIGDLRSVLSSWCSDLGLSFFWDPVSNKFIFKPRNSFSQTPIKYEDIIALPEALEVNYSENILDTYSQGFIGTYERPGGLEEYQCQESTWKMLRPLTLDDFFLKSNKPLASKYNEILSPRNVAVALSYYSPTLRDAFLWFSHYGIQTAQDAEKYLSSSSSSVTPPSTPTPSTPSTPSPPSTTRIPSQGKSSNSTSTTKGNTFVASINTIPANNFSYNTRGNDNCGSINNLNSSSNSVGDPSVLTFFGNMIIKKVYAQNSDDPESGGVFQQLKGLMTTELKEFYDQFTIGQNPGYYFFIAEVSEDGYDEAVNVDRNLATQVLGKYYFNKFRTIVTGASDDESECEIGTPDEDASGQWYKAKQGTENMEIFKYGHDENSLIDTLKKSIKTDIDENKNVDQKRLGKQGLNKDPEDYVANSFVLVNRNGPKWSPEKEYADKWFGKFYAWWGDQIFRKFIDSNGRPDVLFQLFPEASFNENIKLFIVKEVPQGFNVSVDLVRHPLEQTGGSKIRLEEDQFGQQFSINEGPWGLLSTNCYQIRLDGDAMPIFPPPGSFIQELNSYQDECETVPSYSLLNDELYSPASTSYSGPGYRTFISCSSEFPKLKNKFHHVFALEPLNIRNVRKVTYVNYQLSEDNVAIFGDSCIPDKNKLDSYLRDLGSTSQYSYSDKFFQINFKLADVIPKIWTLEQGLSSISVEVTENGTFTSYGFSTKVIQPPSLTFMEQNFRNQKRAAFGNKIGLLSSVKAKTIRH